MVVNDYVICSYAIGAIKNQKPRAIRNWIDRTHSNSILTNSECTLNLFFNRHSSRDINK